MELSSEHPHPSEVLTKKKGSIKTSLCIKKDAIYICSPPKNLHIVTQSPKSIERDRENSIEKQHLKQIITNHNPEAVWKTFVNRPQNYMPYHGENPPQMSKSLSLGYLLSEEAKAEE